MSNEINGKRIAFLVAPQGVDHQELITLWEAVKDAGGKPVLLSTSGGSIVTRAPGETSGEIFLVDGLVVGQNAEDFSGLIVPGGTDHIQFLRGSSAAAHLVTDFIAAGKPVAAISQGPRILIDAGVLRGKVLTGWPGLAENALGAGAQWTAEDVQFCPNQGWMLVTGRSTAVLPKFAKAMVTAFI
ncbi:DJ-1/PfpI family protein [Arthrobacter sp. Sr24]